MSLKYHIIHFIVKDMEKQLEIDQKKVKSILELLLDPMVSHFWLSTFQIISPGQEPPAKSPFLDRWIKWQLTGREPDGFPVYQENFLRQVSSHTLAEFSIPGFLSQKGTSLDWKSCQKQIYVLQAVKEFPFPESQLFKMLVTNFSMCKVLN